MGSLWQQLFPCSPSSRRAHAHTLTTMGQGLSRKIRFWKLRKNRRVLLLGMDNAGKSTVLYRLHAGKAVKTVPTIGHNVESVKFAGLEMVLWDVGGQEQLRGHWRHYYTGTQGIVFIVDSADGTRFQAVAEELQHVLADQQLDGVPVLVLANKQDMPGAASAEEIAKAADLEATCAGREWTVQAAEANEGKGLEEGFQWLCQHMKRL